MPPVPSLSGRVQLVGYGLSATGAVLFATKGVIIKLIYGHGVDTTTLLAWRMALATPVFLAVGLIQWFRLAPTSRPGLPVLGKAAAVGVLGYYVSSWLDFEGL
jgi:drug/metabolite transporter (DMT)-like permease